MAATKTAVQTAVEKEKAEKELKKMLEEIAAFEKREKEKRAKGVDASLQGLISPEELAKAHALELEFKRKKEEELAKQRAIEADLDRRNLEAAMQASREASLTSAFPPTATAAPITSTIPSSAASSSTITIGASATAIDNKSDDELTNMRALQDKLNAEEKRKRLEKENADNRTLTFSPAIRDLHNPYKTPEEEDADLALAVDFAENAAHHEAEALYKTQYRAATALWNSKMPNRDPKAADHKKYSEELKRAQEYKAAALKLLSEIRQHSSVVGIPHAKKPIGAHDYTADFIKPMLPKLIALDTYFGFSNPNLTLELISAEMNEFNEAQFKLVNRSSEDIKLSADDKKKNDEQLTKNSAELTTKRTNIANSFARVMAARGVDGETGAHAEQFISRSWTLAKKMGLVEQTTIAALFSDNTELWKDGVRGGCIPGIVARLWSPYVITLTTLLAPQLNGPASKTKATASTSAVAHNAAATGSTISSAASSAAITTAASVTTSTAVRPNH